VNRRRYRIEANTKTLAKFINVLANKAPYNSFVQRVTPDSNEEYHYVVVIAESEVHDALKEANFRDSNALL
jgi:hypothetical protein